MSHAFVCLPTLELTTFEQQVCLIKNRFCKCTIVGGKQTPKKECEHFRQRRSSKKRSANWQCLVWTTTERCTLLFLNFMNLRDLFGVWRKLKESIFKNSNQISSTVTTRTGIFSKRWTRAFDVSMLGVVLQNIWVLYHINKDEVDESLPLLACNFSKVFKGRQINLEPWRNSECPIRCLLWGSILSGAI